MAGLENRWTSLVDEHGPLATGLLGVGDTLVHTNPTHGQGLPLTLRAVQWVAHNADAVRGAELVTAHHRWAVGTLKPWFDRQVAADRAEQDRLAGRAAPTSAPTSDPNAAARAVCAMEDPVVMRARAQARHMVLPPELAYDTPEIRSPGGCLDRRQPGFTPPPGGPSRQCWEELTGSRTGGNTRDRRASVPAD